MCVGCTPNGSLDALVNHFGVEKGRWWSSSALLAAHVKMAAHVALNFPYSLPHYLYSGKVLNAAPVAVKANDGILSGGESAVDFVNHRVIYDTVMANMVSSHPSK